MDATTRAARVAARLGGLVKRTQLAAWVAARRA
jgi:hypothetical protein